MKRLIIIIAASLLTASGIYAKPTGLNLGGGLAASFFTGCDVNEVTSSYGPYLEVGYDISLNRRCLIYTGIRYNQKFGYGDFERVKELTSMGEITVPVKFQLVFNPMSKTKFFIEAGPSLDLITTWSNKETGESGWIDLMKDGDYNMVNVLIGGNFGVKFNDHIKLAIGGDYALARVSDVYDDIRKWQLNIGVSYIF